MANRPRKRVRAVSTAATEKAVTRTRARGGNKFTALGKLSDDSAASFGSQYITRASRVARGDTYLETGIFPLDLALLGGIPENRVSMFVGWESSGKTTLAARVAASAQRKYPDKAVAWIDAEHTLDLDWIGKHGVDADSLFLAEPPQAEMIIDMVQGFMETGEVSLIVVDSLPAMVPKATGESSAFDVQVADRARLIGKMCSKILDGISDSKARGDKITVIFINQWRDKIGGPPQGSKKTMPGGVQPRYLSSVILDLYNIEKKGASDDEAMSLVQKNTHGFTVKKSKLGNSLRAGEWDMVRDPSHPLGEGHIDDYLATLTYAKRFDLYNGAGTRQDFAEAIGISETFKNKDAAIRFLQENPEDYNRVKQAAIVEWRRRSNLPPIPNDGWLLGACE